MPYVEVAQVVEVHVCKQRLVDRYCGGVRGGSYVVDTVIARRRGLLGGLGLPELSEIELAALLRVRLIRLVATLSVLPERPADLKPEKKKEEKKKKKKPKSRDVDQVRHRIAIALGLSIIR